MAIDSHILQVDEDTLTWSMFSAAKIAHWVESCRNWLDADQKSLMDMIKATIKGSMSMAEVVQAFLDKVPEHERPRENLVTWFLERSSFGARMLSKFPELAPDVAEAIVVHAEGCRSWCCDEDSKRFFIQDGSIDDFLGMLVEYHSSMDSRLAVGRVFPGASVQFRDQVMEALRAPELKTRVRVQYGDFVSDVAAAIISCAKQRGFWPHFLQTWLTSLVDNGCGLEEIGAALVEYHSTANDGSYLNQMLSHAGQQICIFDQDEFKSNSATTSSAATMSTAKATAGKSQYIAPEAKAGLDPVISSNAFTGAEIASNSARVQNNCIPPFAVVAYLPYGMEVTVSSTIASAEEVQKGWVQLMHPFPGWVRVSELKMNRYLLGFSKLKTSANCELFSLMHQIRQWIGPSPLHKCSISARRLLDNLLEREQSGGLLRCLGHGTCREVSGSFLAEEERRTWWPPNYQCWVPHTFLAFADGSIVDLTADQWDWAAPQLWWPADIHRYSLSSEEADEAEGIRHSINQAEWRRQEEQDKIMGVWRTRRKWQDIEKIASKSAAYNLAQQASWARMAIKLDDGLRLQDVVFAAWVTAGYLPEQSRDDLAHLMQFVREHGIRDTVFCDHPGGYPIPGEGCVPYPQYVDMVIAEIDKEPRRVGRPLVLFAQGWGASHALALAARLGPRVLKVYIVGRGPLMLGGLPSYWDTTSRGFKQKGENSILEYLRFVHPGNVLFEKACSANPQELKKMFDQSPWFTRMVNHARMAFRDGIYPDMSKDLRVISCPMCVITALPDVRCTPEMNLSWILWTTGDYQAFTIDGGHYGCLKPKKERGKITSFPLGDLLVGDMKKSLQKATWKQLCSLTSSYFMTRPVTATHHGS